MAEGTKDADVIVIGGGLAGLGVATSLVINYGQKVIVLDKTSPKLDGNDRFNPAIAASFKNAGMFDLGAIFPGVKEHFSRKTAELYKSCGVDLRDEGAFVMASSLFQEIAADAVLQRVSRGKFREEEPNVRLSPHNDAVLKFPKGSQAEPESTMRLLIERAEALESLQLLYGEKVAEMEYAERSWSVRTTSAKVLAAPRLVIAAGPGSRALLQRLDLDLPMQQVYGVISQSQELTSPWLEGSILGAKSYVFWMKRQLCACFSGTNTLEATSWFGESRSWTTHLYLNVHNNRIYLGGPRIAIPDNFPPAAVTPATYARNLREAEDYSKRLIQYPEGVSFELDQTWGGIMAFPDDADYPFVGPVSGVFDNSLFLNTGFGSAGFREAPGAGEFLACMMQEGVEALKRKVGRENGRDFDRVLPSGRVGRV